MVSPLAFTIGQDARNELRFFITIPERLIPQDSIFKASVSSDIHSSLGYTMDHLAKVRANVMNAVLGLMNGLDVMVWLSRHDGKFKPEPCIKRKRVKGGQTATRVGVSITFGDRDTAMLFKLAWHGQEAIAA